MLAGICGANGQIYTLPQFVGFKGHNHGAHAGFARADWPLGLLISKLAVKTLQDNRRLKLDEYISLSLRRSL